MTKTEFGSQYGYDVLAAVDYGLHPSCIEPGPLHDAYQDLWHTYHREFYDLIVAVEEACE